ncbi:MAG: methylated-DNA--[protein]-cysteine S-methyltransferase [Pseudonocardiales bacterium]|nr:methylated-DNA--[protein]-cysteine S-methyltransferase [Pseudonocardiales bacterium]
MNGPGGCMGADGFVLFETAIGHCGIVWCGPAIVCVQLPEANERATRARITRLYPEKKEIIPPPAFVQTAINDIVSLVAGRSSDLSTIALDMDGVPPFHRKVYELARSIPPGQTLTYTQVADKLGAHGSAKAVGQALSRNPFAIVVPCHRVVAAGAKPGGFSAHGGVATKLRLLAIEQSNAIEQATLLDQDTASTTPAADTADLECDYGFDPAAAVAHLRTADRHLARLMDRVGPFDLRMNTAPTTFGMLAEALVYQQLSGKAAATIFRRMCALFGPNVRCPTPQNILSVDEETLRNAGLSRAKALAVVDLAVKVEQGLIPPLNELRGMDDERVIVCLTQVRGIGKWTAQMFLIFRLGRPDVLPADDFGLRKGFKLTFRTNDMPDRQRVERHAELWRPYRTAATWYLWQALELAQDEL